jgi:hypothetical protein
MQDKVPLQLDVPQTKMGQTTIAKIAKEQNKFFLQGKDAALFWGSFSYPFLLMINN